MRSAVLGAIRFLAFAGLLALVLTPAVTSPGPATAAERPILIAFRYDDYSAVSPTAVEARIIDMFRGNGLCCTFAVIPFVCAGDFHDNSPQAVVPLPEAKAALLRQAMREGTVEVAQHGWSHQTLQGKALGYTEFAGVGYGVQERLIADGKRHLERLLGTRIDIFVPPWDSYDAGTVQAIDRLGFGILSARARIAAADNHTRLKFLPQTCGLSDLRAAVEAARRLPGIQPGTQPVIVVLFHPFDFIEADGKRGVMSCGELAGLLRWVKAQKDLRALSVGQTAALVGDLGARRYALFSAYRRLPHHLAPAPP
jgi:peptidoglycan/xylan/chitin deacetylase (PgdA/CDA1 family)